MKLFCAETTGGTYPNEPRHYAKYWTVAESIEAAVTRLNRVVTEHGQEIRIIYAQTDSLFVEPE